MVAARYETRCWLAALLMGAMVCTYGCGSHESKTREFAIEGMSCEGCANTLASAIKGIPGVESAEVSLKEKKASVVADAKAVPSPKIEAAIRTAGYRVRSNSSPAAGAPKSD